MKSVLQWSQRLKKKVKLQVAEVQCIIEQWSEHQLLGTFVLSTIFFFVSKAEQKKYFNRKKTQEILSFRHLMLVPHYQILIVLSAHHSSVFCFFCLSGKTEYQATHGGRLRRASTFERRPSKRYPSRTQSLGKGETGHHTRMWWVTYWRKVKAAWVLQPSLSENETL